MKKNLKKFVFFGLCWLSAAGCGQGVAENRPVVNRAPNANVSASPVSSATPANNNSANAPAPIAQNSANSAIKTFNGKGVVTKIDLEIVSVELDHEEIKGLMPPMKMEFYVREKSELEKLKIGDRVDFVLEDNAGAEKITSIKKAK